MSSYLLGLESLSHLCSLPDLWLLLDGGYVFVVGGSWGRPGQGFWAASLLAQVLLTDGMEMTVAAQRRGD